MDSFVIYHVPSHHTYGYKTYRTYQGARCALTKYLKSGALDDQYRICSAADFNANDYEVEVTSLMNPNGAKCKIRRSQLGGCCDPSTERYWSMHAPDWSM